VDLVLRRVRRLVLLGSLVAGVLAWRERKLSENADRFGLPNG
jgi:hypothetical protein